MRTLASYLSGISIMGCFDNIEIVREGNNAIGDGSGREAATVAGVVGGAVVGHQVEKRNSQQNTYRIRVRLEHGGY